MSTELKSLQFLELMNLSLRLGSLYRYEEEQIDHLLSRKPDFSRENDTSRVTEVCRSKAKTCCLDLSLLLRTLKKALLSTNITQTIPKIFLLLLLRAELSFLTRSLIFLGTFHSLYPICRGKAFEFILSFVDLIPKSFHPRYIV